MIRKFSYPFLLICLLAAGTTGVAMAHETEAAGSVSAVLHIEPNDIVTTGKPATYEIEFADTTGRFKLADCGCVLQTKHDEAVVATSSLHAANDNTATGSLIFPATGEDEVAVIGTPKTAGAFEAFDLEFPVTVRAAHSNWALWYGAGAAAIGLLVVTVSVLAFGRRPAKAKP